MFVSKLEQSRTRLPIYAIRQHLLNCIQKHSTLVLIGETGSGKSTQIPQYLYEEGLLGDGDSMVAITQPRRVAAITLAKRVTHEKRSSRIGALVGFAVRFENCTSDKTKIKYMTDGILLREAINDRYLKKYSFIILDEAHERTINTDVLFGIVKKVQKDRKLEGMQELKILIMSATMDVDHFSKYFDSCPVLYLPGRTYAVQILHAKQKQDDYMFAALATLFEIHKTAPAQHDVLIFLTGKDEIESMCHQIKNISKSSDLDGRPALRVFPLYSTLSQQRQMEVFTPTLEGMRRVIVATNVAETSITIPGIRYVIDTGVVKTRSYDPISGMDSLKVTKISQAQAWQRTGRSGRESDGTCYRTYTAREMEQFDKMTKPEILRCNLTSAVLQLLMMAINIETFDFIDKPPRDAIDGAFRQLKQLGAIKSIQNPQLTETGRRMAKFPIDPTYSKIIISSQKFECTSEILDIVAILSSENIYSEPHNERRDTAQVQHLKYASKYGDHQTLLNVFSQFQKTENPKMWATDHYFNIRNLSYARDVRQQLADICKSFQIPIAKATPPHGNIDQIRKCLITGLFNNIAEYQPRENHYMVLVNRQRAQIHPSSVLSGYHGFNGLSSTNGNGIVSASSKMRDGHGHLQKPSYVIFSEIVQTTQNYLRTVTRIEPEWIREVIQVSECGHLNRINFNQL